MAHRVFHSYDKREYRFLTEEEPHRLWAMYHTRSIIGEAFYTMSTNNLSEEDDQNYPM